METSPLAQIELAPSAAPKVPWFRQADALVAVGVTILILLCHLWFSPNVGGLWRDETTTTHLATAPTWGDLWTYHVADSFPLLFASMLRVWSAIFGSSDDSLRIVGTLLGLGGVAALWINARLLGLRFPFWSLVLVGANPMIIRYGDSIRAYGLGILLLLLMFGTVWKVVESDEKKWFGWAALSSVLAVQTIYYNAVLLFALCCAGGVVALQERRWRTLGKVIAVGAIAAISLVPYLPTLLRANDWNFLVQYPFTLPWMWKRLTLLIGAPHWLGVFVWPAITLIAMAVAGWTLWPGRQKLKAPLEDRRRILFCGISLVVGAVAYFGFLKLLNYYTQVWYYVALLTFLGACIDPLLRSGNPRFVRTRMVLSAALAVVFLAISAIPSIAILGSRHTNMDQAAQTLTSLVAPDDLVLLTRWECSGPMLRYYKGAAPWMTIPPLSELRFQSYQPILAHMREEAPLEPIFTKAEATLRAGHRVWVMGEVPALPPGQKPPILPRVREDGQGWRGSAQFYMVWVMQVSEFLQHHVSKTGSVPVLRLPRGSSFEDLPLHFTEGWHD